MTDQTTPHNENVHGTCITIKGHGVLLMGASGSGKSDCALRLLDAGAMLISDDRTILTADAATGQLVASSPAPIKGLMEIRGIGVVRWESVDEAPLRLVISATDSAAVPRMPDLQANDSSATFAGITVPRFQFDLRHAAAPAKIRTALDIVTGARRLIT